MSRSWESLRNPGKSKVRHRYTKHRFSTIFQNTGKVRPKEVCDTMMIGLRPLRGRKPIRIGLGTYFGRTFPVFWKINENLFLVYLWRTFDFPGFRRLSQVLDIAILSSEREVSAHGRLAPAQRRPLAPFTFFFFFFHCDVQKLGEPPESGKIESTPQIHQT